MNQSKFLFFALVIRICVAFFFFQWCKQSGDPFNARLQELSEYLDLLQSAKVCSSLKQYNRVKRFLLATVGVTEEEEEMFKRIKRIKEKDGKGLLKTNLLMIDKHLCFPLIKV